MARGEPSRSNADAQMLVWVAKVREEEDGGGRGGAWLFEGEERVNTRGCSFPP